MRMASRVDPSTLGWVKSEIDNTLQQARVALESYAESTSDETRLRFFITHVHQVTGTLQMVELDGAALLSHEIEVLGEALLDGKVEPDEALFELLSRALLTLSDYLDQLLAGHPDVPLRLLPLLNRLREQSRIEPITEVDLFNPDLSVYPPSAEGDAIDDGMTPARLRSRYQAALLAWLKQGGTESLAEMRSVVASCRNLCRFGSVAQLWWVAEGFLESLIDGGITIDTDNKKLLGRLDLELGRMVKDGEGALVRNPPDLLIKQFLYQVGRSQSRGQCVNELRGAFDLAAILPEISPDTTDLEPPASEALQTAGTMLLEEIEAAQGQLSGYFDPDRSDVNDLGGLLAKLNRIASTLDALGAQWLKVLADSLIDGTRALMDGSVEMSESASLAMAGGLLQLEHCTKDITREPRLWQAQIDAARRALDDMIAGREPEIGKSGAEAAPGIEISEEELSGSEFRQLLQVVAGEVVQNLRQIEKSLEALAAEPDRLEHLDEVPRQLGQIQGTMQMLGQERAADLISMTRGYIGDLRRGGLAPEPEVMDALAVAVGTVDAYMEGLKRESPNLSDLIDRAVDELDRVITGRRAVHPDPASLIVRMRDEFDSWINDPEDRALLRTLKHNLRELGAVADRQGEAKVKRLGAEIVQLLDVVSDDISHVADDIGPTLQKSMERLLEMAAEKLSRQVASDAQTPAPAMPEMPPAVETTTPEEVPDPDILEIFLEEANEVLQQFAELVPRWKDAPADDAVLSDIRRGFHTLKGSGRLAGAMDIGELAWVVEDLLNQCLQGGIVRGNRLFDFVERGSDTIRRLVEGYESGSRSYIDLAEWKDQARALQELAEDESPVATKSAAKVATTEPAAPPVANGSGKLSPVTIGIFSKEARSHVEMIRRLSSLGADDEPARRQQVFADALRALHTLQGISRSMGLKELALLGEELEELLALRSRGNATLGSADQALLAGVCATIEQVVEGFERDRSLSDDLAARLEELAARCRAHADGVASNGEQPWYTQATASETALEQVVEVEAEPASQPTPEVIAEVPAPVMDEAPPPVVETPPAAVQEVVSKSAPLDAAEVADLNAIFIEEAVDVLDQLEQGLQRWRAEPNSREAVGSLKRSLHTLKGSARTVGANVIGDLSHNTESLLELVGSGQRAPNRKIIDLLEEVHDTLVTMIDRLQSGGQMPLVDDLSGRVTEAIGSGPVVTEQVLHEPESAPIDSAADDLVQDFFAPTAATPRSAPVADTRAVEEEQAPAIAAIEESADAEETVMPAAAAAGAGAVSRQAAIRVNPALLDNLSNYAGEVSIARSRIQQQVRGFKENLNELRSSVNRFRDQIRDLEIQAESQIMARPEATASDMGEEFDPLEFDRYSKLQYLSRSLAESLNDLTTIQSGLDSDAGAVETALLQQARLNTELQEGLMKTRLVAFSTQVPRLRHTARQLAREVDKQVELEFKGAESEIDRNLLERMLGPLEHMIRNAIDHGIEDTAARKAAGKPAVGRVAFDCSREGNDFVIRLSDDGRGLDVDAIRRRALERGIIQQDAVFSDNDLYQFIMLPGFTTREQVTQLSGRGVGMDVVYNEVRQLGGRISVESTSGRGVAFTMHLPLSLSVMQALVVRIADQPFAIPVTSVVNILKVRPQDLPAGTNGDARFDHLGRSYPLMNLRERLGFPPPTVEFEDKVPLILVHAGEQEVMLQVDALVNTQEIVVKPLGAQITEVQGIEGATVLGDGSVVLILNVAELWLMKQVSLPAAVAVPSPADQRKTVMVIDDSLTVRTVTERHLRKHGIEVVQAKDGVEALEKLRDLHPDVMLVDIEMPRMDGYELTSRVRENPDTANIPIIIITSRAGAKHKQKAMELGADRYLTKPYQEDVLMSEIDGVLAERRMH